MKNLLFLAFLIGATSFSFGQKKTGSLEAKLVYEIDYEELPEMLEPYRAMLPKEIICYLKESKMRMEQTAMGVATVNVTDSEKKTGFMLMDQFGTKTAYTLDENDLKEESQNSSENYDINYTTETKEIAGYTCNKVIIKDKVEGTESYAYVTNEIKATNKNYAFLKGFALEYSVHTTNEMTIVMKVKTVEKMKVPKSFFEIPKDYEKKPMSDMKKEMEKMQNDSKE